MIILNKNNVKHMIHVENCDRRFSICDKHPFIIRFLENILTTWEWLTFNIDIHPNSNDYHCTITTYNGQLVATINIYNKEIHVHLSYSVDYEEYNFKDFKVLFEESLKSKDYQVYSEIDNRISYCIQL